MKVKRISDATPTTKALCPFCPAALWKIGQSYMCTPECSFTAKYLPSGKYEVYYKDSDISVIGSLILNYINTADPAIRDRIKKLLVIK